MIYDIGDKVTLSTVVRTEAGTPVNTPTVTIAVTKPDGTLVAPAPSVTNTASGGLYTAQVTVDQSDLWRYVWTASGSVVATEPGQLTVAAARALVASMEEFKVHLNRSDSSVGAVAAADDAELRTYLASATDWVEYAVGGPLSVQSFTERVETRGWYISPRRQPLVAVTSLTPDLGSALSASAYVVSTDLGIIQLLTGSQLCGWYTLVYTAGLTAIPERVKLAGLILAQHLWQTQNGGGGLPVPGDDGLAVVAGMGFAVPNRVKELLARELAQAAGFA